MNRAFSIVWNSSRQVWAVAPEGVARARASSGRPGAAARGRLQLAVAVCLLGFAGAAAADCTGTTDIVCTPGVDQTTAVGSGPGTASGTTVTVQAGAVVSTGEQAAISTGDNSVISIQAGATVQNAATTNDGGFYGAGPNTIEFGSNNTLTIAAGATVRATGNSGTGEAINPIGTGNTIINNGTIDSQAGGAAIWMQSSDGSTTIVNGATGTINFGGGGGVNLIGVSGTMAVNFTNQGALFGSVFFGDGNDTYNAGTGSTISGSIDGGAGINTLQLSGTGTDTFSTGFANFQTLLKTDSGTWTFNSLTGSGITSAEVAGGTLVLGADSSGYTGSMTVDAAGTLQTSAAFMPLAIADNGLVRFDQPGDASYTGLLSGSGGIEKTGGGTLIFGGDQAITGTTTISGGILQLGTGGSTGSVGGPIVDNAALAIDHSNTFVVSQPISGSGSVSQIGTGTTIYTADNSYAGGTTISAGTLQLGDGGATGSLVGPVLDNAALVVNRSNTLTLAGVISGSGSFAQIGSGTTILAADNTYGGGTTISAGTLQLGNGGSTGSVAGPILNNGALAIDHSNSFTIAAAISGTGSLAQIGSGATILTADNTYVGGTTISAGTLQLGNGGTTGSVAGPILNNGALAIDHSNSFTIAAAISGTGSLAQIGSGTTILAADNSYGGGTTISAGTLQLGNGGTTGSIPGPITDNGALAVDHSNAFTIAAPISGSGSFAQIGSGTTILAADNTYGGGTTISAGTLQLGNGGSTGSVAGPILNNGALAIDHSNSFTIAAAISGTGSLAQIGSGTTILTADNSYGGGTTISAGTLQLGNGGATGSIPGPITDDGALAVDHSNAFTIAAPISGSGSFAQIGSGTTILAADNTYGGGTTISAGTLQLGNGGTTGSVVGPILNNGALAIDHSDSFTIAAPISGGGSLWQIGSGTTILTADNTYVGGTTIGAGTLQLGNGGTTGSVVGPILNNGALAIDHSDSFTIAAPISGGGGLWQIGSGTTTLTADNTYVGGTTISAGTLQLGNGGMTGSVVGPILNNGALAIDRSDSFTIAAPISGGGSLAQIGSGTTILAAANTYSGTTTVASGTLQAAATNAFSAASAHVVAAGATLDSGGFNQTLAALSNSGTVNLLSSTPGSTLTVTGAYVGNGGVINLGTVLAGSTSLSDRLVLSGPSASASGSTTLRITNLGGLGAQTTGSGIEVVSAINGATTTAQTSKSAFALAGGHVDAGAYSYQLYAADASGAGENWYLRSSTTSTPVTPDPPGPPFPLLPDVPMPPGGGVTTYRSEVPLLAALPAQLRQSDLSMLGNLHRRVGDEAVPGDGAATGDAGNGRQAWARAIYNDIDIRQDGIASAQSQGHVSGLQAGTDLFASHDWRAGIYVGSLEGSADVSGNAHGIVGAVGNNELRSRYLGGYATWFGDNGLYVDSVLQGGSHDYTAQPNDAFSASGKASTLTASVEGGKAFDLGQGWKIEPQAQLIYQRASVDNLLISGALVRQDADAGWIGRLGVRIKGDIATGAGRLQPYARVNVYRASGGTDLTSFIGPAASTAIGSATGYTSTELAGGATLALNPATTLYGEIGQLYGSGGAASVKSSFQGSLGIRVSW